MTVAANEPTTNFVWTKGAVAAALLLAEDELSNAAIAKAAGIGLTTLWRYRQREEFRARVAEHAAALQAEMLRHAVAKRHKRLATLNALHEAALAVIAERGAALAGEAPGAETGLLVKRQKQLGQGAAAQVIDEFAVDTGLLREIRAIEEQAAKELGQWEERQRVAGEVVVRRYIGVDVDEV